MMNGKMKKALLVIVFLVVILIVFLLFVKRPNNTQANTDGIVVKENVSVITKEEEDRLRLTKVNDDYLVFKKNPKYQEGEIIVAGIIDSAPTGFIRRIVNVEKKDDKFIIETENATLVDVFEEVHITKRFLLKEDAVEEVGFTGNEQTNESMSYVQQLVTSTKSLGYTIEKVDSDDDSEIEDQEYAFYQEFAYDISESASISGEVGVDAWLEMELDIKNNNVVFGMSVHSLVEGEVNTGVSYSKEIPLIEQQLFDYKLPPIEVTVGVIPIVITNEITADLNAEASLTGSSSVECGLSVENSQGFQYDSKSNKIKKLTERDYLSDGVEVNTGASATVDSMARVILCLDSRLYGSTGAVLGLGLSGEAEGEISVNKGVETKYVGTLDMRIRPVIVGELIVTVPIIDYQLTQATLFEEELEPLWEKHWEEAVGISESIKDTEYKNQTWKPLFTNVIEDMKKQEKDQFVTFYTPYYADEVTELDGSSVEGRYETNGSELYWYLQDIDNEPDGIPELFIGTEINGKKQIIAVYEALFGDIPCAVKLSAIYDLYGVNSIYFCQANMLFEGYDMPGEEITSGTFIMATADESRRVKMGAYRRGQDEERILDSDTLEWKELKNW